MTSPSASVLTCYCSDDTWNQTAADNAEWLRRFKRDVGILTDSSLPGLPDGNQWNLTQGGSGFAPPYVSTCSGASFDPAAELSITMREGVRPWNAETAIANK